MLQTRWNDLWVRSTGAVAPATKWTQWLGHHRETQRHYHTDRHIEECFLIFDEIQNRLTDPPLVAWALFFHDLIYDPKSNDNEKRSADLAASILADSRLEPHQVGIVTTLIRSTQAHHPCDHPDGPFLLDIDLAILSAPAPRFLEYEGQIRAEYEFVPQPIYCQKRAEILEEFRNRPRIYSAGFMGPNREERARENLQKSLEFLRLGKIPRAYA
jgi:predicted metal-dependent HD superfamily phosphohydrolase